MKRWSHAGAWIEARALLHRHRRELAAGLGLVLVNRLAALALPVSSKYAIDEVVGKGHGDLLLPIAGAAATGVVLQAATSFAVAHRTGIAAERAVARLRQELYTHVLRLPVRTFDVTPTGTLVSRLMTDAEQIRTVLGPGLVQLASSVLTAGLALGVLMALNAPLTLLLIALLTAFTLALGRAFGWFRQAFLQVSVLQGELTARISETLSGIRVVKAFAAERAEVHAFAQRGHRLLRTRNHTVIGVASLGAGLSVLTGAVSVLMLSLLIQRVAAGSMTLGDLALFVMLVGLLVTPLIQLAALGSEAGRSLSALQRLHELRALPAELTINARRQAAPRFTGTVVFDDVSYAYVPGRLVLQHINFTAPAGSSTAIVGRSGSGKSTICRLLLAFDEPTHGRVLVDGHDLATVSRRAYRGQLGVVLQDGVLFDGTIGDNIRYGRSGASGGEMRRAARLAHCEEFVARLPRGYDTLVGERGVQLSGGQRQRIAIARALLANPRILILDEATSQLDIESEALVQDALRTLRQGRTTFVVAHRQATLRAIDQILVLENGRVMDHGTPLELAGRGNRYLACAGTDGVSASDASLWEDSPHVA